MGVAQNSCFHLPGFHCGTGLLSHTQRHFGSPLGLPMGTTPQWAPPRIIFAPTLRRIELRLSIAPSAESFHAAAGKLPGRESDVGWVLKKAP